MGAAQGNVRRIPHMPIRMREGRSREPSYGAS